MEQYKLFFSFQSDKKSASNKILKALCAAKKDLVKEDIDLVLVMGAQYFSGMADIPAAIDKNISVCDLFLADLTPTNFTGEKANPNANVMMELGQAKAYLGFPRMIGVAVKDLESTWECKNLPFDISVNRLKIVEPEDEIKLVPLIMYCIDYIRNPVQRMIDDTKETLQQKHELGAHPVDGTLFFVQRLSQTFPGIRGVKTITEEEQIKQHLDLLLAPPLKFERQDGERGDVDPIWIFRGSEAENISSYRYLGNRHFLLGWNEFYIKSLTVFRDNGLYYKEYVLIETFADSPTGLYDTAGTGDKELKEMKGYSAEEYAVYTDSDRNEHIISRASYDDNAALINGKICTNLNAELRIRYLTPVNYLLTAKFSSFNCRKFCQTSQEYMDGLLNGSVSFNDFHEYLMTFEKPAR